jgi:hypothetical protein
MKLKRDFLRFGAFIIILSCKLGFGNTSGWGIEPSVNSFLAFIT